MAHILVTGATGAIGVPLVRQLLRDGNHVSILCRDRPGLRQYVDELFGPAVGVFIGDVTLPMCGVEESVVKRFNAARLFDILIHAAGKTHYHEHLREETYAANVGGTQHAANLAQALRVERLVYISTAYVAGKAAYLSEEEQGRPELSHNPYESSKIVAEDIVRGYPGRPLILRLGTVIGEAKTGSIVNAGGYAGFVKGFWALRQRIAEFPRNPLYVALNPDTTLNLVTSEWTVEHIAKAARSSLVGTVHLAHPRPVNMRWLFERTFHREFDLPLTHDRTRFIETALWNNRLWRKTQERIMAHVSYFGPYVTRDTAFAHVRATEIFGYRPPLPITGKVVSAQMRYMIEHLFPNKEEERTLVAAE